jgi:hypothetical protein
LVSSRSEASRAFKIRQLPNPTRNQFLFYFRACGFISRHVNFIAVIAAIASNAVKLNFVAGALGDPGIVAV